MNKAIASLALVLGGLLGVTALAPAAQAYPEPTIEVSVSDQSVHAGATFTSSSEASVDCTWTHQWNGKSSTGHGKKHTATWVAPNVKKKTVIPLYFACDYDATFSAGRSVLVPAATVTRTIDVTVLPGRGRQQGQGAPAGSASDLPNSGGPDKSILLGGLLLLLLGGIAVRAARSRATQG